MRGWLATVDVLQMMDLCARKGWGSRRINVGYKDRTSVADLL